MREPNCQVGDEVRTIAQVVGHIAKWERFAILGYTDILAGIGRPRMMVSLEGFVEPDGTNPKFASDTEFNAYQAAKHSQWTRPQIQTLAIDTSMTLHARFIQPNLLTAERMEKTRVTRKRFTNGVTINKIGLGWSLWLTMLEHLAIEHAQELRIE